MKKWKFYLLVVILLGTGGGFLLQQTFCKSNRVDLLTLENIEAIARSETDSEGRVTCYSSFVGKDKGDKTVKDCGDCMDVNCIDYSDSGKCKK